jgi:antitoxin component YwqK of YwqJK toxin-antitoxin module
MKKISAFILAISFLIFIGGCSEKTTEKTTSEIQERNGLAYAINENEPFTGVHKAFYPNGQKKRESYYKDGKSNGLTLG